MGDKATKVIWGCVVNRDVCTPFGWERYWEFSNLWHNTRFGKTNLTMLANIGWNANDQKLEVRWSLLRKVHHFGREIMNSDISRIYWNSQNLREDLVLVTFIEAFSLWFQITELHNYENCFLLLFTLSYHGPFPLR